MNESYEAVGWKRGVHIVDQSRGAVRQGRHYFIFIARRLPSGRDANTHPGWHPLWRRRRPAVDHGLLRRARSGRGRILLVLYPLFTAAVTTAAIRRAAAKPMLPIFWRRPDTRSSRSTTASRPNIPTHIWSRMFSVRSVTSATTQPNGTQIPTRSRLSAVLPADFSAIWLARRDRCRRSPISRPCGSRERPGFKLSSASTPRAVSNLCR